jgi:ankyrin repeat protein
LPYFHFGITVLQNGRNALHLASSAGHSDVVAALILAGCDVNVSDSVSISPAVLKYSLKWRSLEGMLILVGCKEKLI